MSSEWNVVSKYPTQRCARRSGPLLDRLIAEIAARQHGVISLTQLHTLGLTTTAVMDRVAAGKLHPIHRGVYAVGHRRLTREGYWMAAVLACGADAFLSHRSAALLHCLLRYDGASAIDVTAPRRVRPRRGIRVHYVSDIDESELTIVDGIPTTTVARTLLDLAAVVRDGTLGAAIREAEVRRVFDLRALQEVLDRARGRRGARRLRAALAAYDSSAEPTRSELERMFHALCRTAGLPAPRVNALIEVDGGTVEADFSWPSQRLNVETDGGGTHGTLSGRRRDIRRDQLLTLASWRVVRFDWREVVFDPDRVAGTVRSLLARATA